MLRLLLLWLIVSPVVASQNSNVMQINDIYSGIYARINGLIHHLNLFIDRIQIENLGECSALKRAFGIMDEEFLAMRNHVQRLKNRIIDRSLHICRKNGSSIDNIIALYATSRTGLGIDKEKLLLIENELSKAMLECRYHEKQRTFQILNKGIMTSLFDDGFGAVVEGLFGNKMAIMMIGTQSENVIDIRLGLAEWNIYCNIIKKKWKLGMVHGNLHDVCPLIIMSINK